MAPAQMPTARFSKETVARHVFARIAALQDQYGFEWERGSSQVEGAAEDVVRAFGAYDELRELVEEWGLK